VVIGSGPAGAAVANRLAGDGRSVVLVEAGPGGPRPRSLVGLDLVAASAEASRHWDGLAARPRPGGPGRDYRQGRGLGGGSMINGMLLTPGDSVDYRRWEADLGCSGWGPEAMTSFLGRAVAAYPAVEPRPGPVSRALARAAEADGLAVGGTSLDRDRLGVLAARLAAVGGRRWSAADAHLDGDGPPDPVGRPGVRAIAGRPLIVVTGVAVDRIVVGGAGADPRVALISGEVIGCSEVVVCAGALATPALLLRSGLAARPVGGGLRDHPSYAFTLVLRDRPPRVRADPADERVVSTVVRWSSDSGGADEVGDLQAVAIDRVDAPGGGPPLAVVAVGLMAVSSSGSVTVDPAGPDVGGGPGGRPGPLAASVVTGALATDSDRRRFREGVRRVARWLRSPAMAEVVAEVHLDDRGTPLTRIDGLGEADLDALLASRPGPYAHPAATCPMGPETDPGSVTACDPGRLGQLLGHPGIRVADASVFPHLVRGGLQIPVTAVALRIADDIAGGSGSPAVAIGEPGAGS
jgi:choline dehydrogenase